MRRIPLFGRVIGSDSWSSRNWGRRPKDMHIGMWMSLRETSVELWTIGARGRGPVRACRPVDRTPYAISASRKIGKCRMPSNVLARNDHCRIDRPIAAKLLSTGIHAAVELPSDTALTPIRKQKHADT